MLLLVSRYNDQVSIAQAPMAAAINENSSPERVTPTSPMRHRKSVRKSSLEDPNRCPTV